MATKKITTKKKVTAKKPVAKKTVASKKVAAKKKTVIKKTVKKVTAKPAAVPMTAPGKVNVTKLPPLKSLLWPIAFLVVLIAAWTLKDQIIVASVNGAPITRFELIRNLEKQGATQVLESLVTEKLVWQTLDEAKIEVSDSEIEGQIIEIEGQIAAQGQNLDDLLEAQGSNRQELKEQLRLTKGVEKILADRVGVTEEEISEYFESNKELLGEDADLEMMHDQIKAQLEQEKQFQAQQEWLQEIKEAAKIKYFKFEPQMNLGLN